MVYLGVYQSMSQSNSMSSDSSDPSNKYLFEWKMNHKKIGTTSPTTSFALTPMQSVTSR